MEHTLSGCLIQLAQINQEVLFPDQAARIIPLPITLQAWRPICYGSRSCMSLRSLNTRLISPAASFTYCLVDWETPKQVSEVLRSRGNEE